MIKIAVTGTKGKTTIVRLVNDCLLNNSSTVACAFTEGIILNGENVTRRRSIDNYRKASKMETDYCIHEATSFMLAEGYYTRPDYDIAVLSGIEPHEHDEIHGDFSRYITAKKKIYRCRKHNAPAIINRDDEHYDLLLEGAQGKIISFGRNPDSDCVIDIESMSRDRMVFNLRYAGVIYDISTALIGEYNARNMAAALVCLAELGVPKETIITSFNKFSGVEGRMEKHQLSDGTVVIIDYAHTPESLKLVLNLLKEVYPGRKLVTVFGCGGDKSKKKRPMMGKISVDISDLVYITNDNCREEDPEKIVEDILAGIETSNYSVILDRAEAIQNAVHLNSKSVILLAGKGAEDHIKEKNNNLVKASDYKMLVSACKNSGLKIN